MSTPKKRSDFATSDEGQSAIAELQAIASDSGYNTTSSYSANSTLYPDHEIPFVDKHMAYLCNHPELDSQQYIANIRLMTKIRG
jgi:hypothetical protein